MHKPGPPIILCVDDEPAALSLRKILLEKSGYRVVPAANAASALELFESQPIDLVISDHLLPGSTGVELTRKMKRSRPFVPVMLFSGVIEPPTGAEHADMFINKADGPEELLKKVANLLRCDRITEGKFFAEIRCDSRFKKIIWHYTIQRIRNHDVLAWSQTFSEEDAIEAARAQMRELNQRDKAANR